MRQETKMILQTVLNSLTNPAFIEKNEVIILSNTAFKLSGYSIKNYKTKISESDLQILTKEVSEDTILYEIVATDIYKLELSKQQLTDAMALL